MRRLAFLSAFLLLPVHAPAETIKFVEHNFSVETPAGWFASKPQLPEMLVFVQDMSGKRAFIVFAKTLKIDPNSIREMVASAKAPLIKAGCKIGPDEYASFGGVPFVSFVAHPPSGATFTSYFAVAGDQAYTVQVISGRPDPAAEAQVKTALQSFKLLVPAKTPSSDFSLLTQVVWRYAMFLLIALSVAMVLIAALLFRHFVLSRRN
jgi:hypothetical protein